jgi:hypothetical protein
MHGEESGREELGEESGARRLDTFPRQRAVRVIDDPKFQERALYMHIV